MTLETLHTRSNYPAYRLAVTMRAGEGSLARLVVMTGSRGWHIGAIRMNPAPWRQRTQLELTVTPFNPQAEVENLKRQIEALHEVEEVELLASPDGGVELQPAARPDYEMKHDWDVRP